MSNSEFLDIFIQSEALLKGHFILSSGLHSDTYLQCARVLMDPKQADYLCSKLANQVKEIISANIDLVVAPAMGGVIVGYEMARQLGVPSIFCERVDGKLTLRRGFNIEPGSNALVVEDVVTTGKSSLETFECIKENGGNVIAEASLVDRSNGTANLGVELISLLSVEAKTFTADQVPEDLKNVEAIKPGSRFIK